MLGKKGQEEAPFALFLAAAMLAILIPIVASMYSNYSSAKCSQEMQHNMETLAREMEIATTLTGNRSMVRVDFTKFRGCSDERITSFQIEDFGATECVRNCQVGNCRMLIAKGDENNLVGHPVCIRVPPELELKYNGCPSPYGHLPIQSTTGEYYMKPSAYTLVFLKVPGTTGKIFRVCCIKTAGDPNCI